MSRLKRLIVEIHRRSLWQAAAGQEARRRHRFLTSLVERAPNYAGDLRLDPLWDPLRDDPRFQALLERHDS